MWLQALVGPGSKVQDHADAVFNSALVDYPRRELFWLACSYQEAASQVMIYMTICCVLSPWDQTLLESNR